LTIGFARRFATYKRGNLLLSDPERLKRILLDQHRPVQLLVAGKAHPNDRFGKALVQQMSQFLAQPELRGRAIFLQDYDMVLGQHMVSGVDVWLNTPLRPNEACGTSGMKVLVNGGLNVSVLDGWWDEVFDQPESGLSPGWIVGSREPGTPEELAQRDAASLFDILENHVIPEFYDRDRDGIPHRWIDRVKESMARLTPQFSATRMLHEYIEHAYVPAARAFAGRSADGAKLADELVQWHDRVSSHWSHVRIGQVRITEEANHAEFEVECWLDDIAVDSVRVELYAEGEGDHPTEVVPMQACRELPGAVNGFVFCCSMDCQRPKSDYAVRIIPHHAAAFVPLENSNIVWDH
jgi:starch phosphorylase